MKLGFRKYKKRIGNIKLMAEFAVIVIGGFFLLVIACKFR